jgi:hypothetical protein
MGGGDMTKSRIWKTLFPYLNDIECDILAENYCFTGAQISNVLKKADIKEIITGNNTSLETILQLCNEEEVITKPKQGIGFLASSS